MLQVQLDGLEELLTDLDRIGSGTFVAGELEKTIARFSQINAQQYQQNRKLPYSPKYLGRLKPSKQNRAGVSGEPGYAMDTLALYNDAVNNWDADGLTLENWSDREYAGYQAHLMEQKGGHFYADDGEYLKVLEFVVNDALTELWSDG